MQTIIYVVIAVFVFGFLKGLLSGFIHKNDRNATPSNKTIQAVRSPLNIPQDVSISWASHHIGMLNGNAAIVNSEYIVNRYYSHEREYSWKIYIADINRYTIEENDKYSFIHFILKDGSEEILTVKNNEVFSFEKEYAEAKEFMEYVMQQ